MLAVRSLRNHFAVTLVSCCCCLHTNTPSCCCSLHHHTTTPNRVWPNLQPHNSSSNGGSGGGSSSSAECDLIPPELCSDAVQPFMQQFISRTQPAPVKTKSKGETGKGSGGGTGSRGRGRGRRGRGGGRAGDGGGVGSSQQAVVAADADANWREANAAAGDGGQFDTGDELADPFTDAAAGDGLYYSSAGGGSLEQQQQSQWGFGSSAAAAAGGGSYGGSGSGVGMLSYEPFAADVEAVWYDQAAKHGLTFTWRDAPRGRFYKVLLNEGEAERGGNVVAHLVPHKLITRHNLESQLWWVLLCCGVWLAVDVWRSFFMSRVFLPSCLQGQHFSGLLGVSCARTT